VSDAKLKEQARVGRALCAELIARGSAHRAVVVSVGVNEDPDVIAEINGTWVAVELTAYRQDDALKEVEAVDHGLCESLRAELNAQPATRGVMLFAHFRKDGARRGGTRPAVPTSPTHADVAREIAQAVLRLKRLPIWDGSAEVEVSFESAETAATMNSLPVSGRGRRYWCFDASEFPKVAEIGVTVSVAPSRPDAAVAVNSEMNWRNADGQPQVVTDLVRKKLAKLSRYRAQTPGCPCWLVIYSEGFPPSAWVAAEDVPVMCDVAREELQRSEQRFDAAWWLDLGMGVGGRRLYLIDGSAVVGSGV
jgi:hypothetical protein